MAQSSRTLLSGVLEERNGRYYLTCGWIDRGASSRVRRSTEPVGIRRPERFLQGPTDGCSDRTGATAAPHPKLRKQQPLPDNPASPRFSLRSMQRVPP
jgi:hypothetical protein